MNESASQIKAIASLMRPHKRAGYKYASQEELIADNGREFKPGGKIPKGWRRGRMGECYMNAYQLADAHNLTYCEGYAIAGNLPIALPHAWCVDKNGNVVDPTWRDGTSYFGVPLNFDFVRRTILARGKYGVIDDMEQRWPMFSEDLPIEEWLGKSEVQNEA